MRFSFLSLLLLCSCKHIGLLFEPPHTLRAVVEGVINDKNIHCEKTLTLDHGKWEVMCRISDDIDVRYRTFKLQNNQTKLEIIVNKQKGGTQKIIAAPVLIIAEGKMAALASVSKKSRLDIRAETLR